uniref:Uncharacterized protein n=1 Tax=Ixodes ricinus TaxID=34613 RepID=A0A6B0V596_IXORI
MCHTVLKIVWSLTETTRSVSGMVLSSNGQDATQGWEHTGLQNLGAHQLAVHCHRAVGERLEPERPHGDQPDVGQVHVVALLLCLEVGEQLEPRRIPADHQQPGHAVVQPGLRRKEQVRPQVALQARVDDDEAPLFHRPVVRHRIVQRRKPVWRSQRRLCNRRLRSAGHRRVRDHLEFRGEGVVTVCEFFRRLAEVRIPFRRTLGTMQAAVVRGDRSGPPVVGGARVVRLRSRVLGGGGSGGGWNAVPGWYRGRKVGDAALVGA